MLCYGSVVVYSLFIVAQIVCGIIVLGHCFGIQYFVSVLVLQSSRWGKESGLLLTYFYCLLDIQWLSELCGSSSRCRVLACTV